jgi:hypothetical protein
MSSIFEFSFYIVGENSVVSVVFVYFETVTPVLVDVLNHLNFVVI